jgi:hypothetical protein
MTGDAGKNRFPFAPFRIRIPWIGAQFYVFPIPYYLLGGGNFPFTEYMRMSGSQLTIEMFYDVIYIEFPSLPRNLGVEDYLQEKVT